MLRQCLCIPTTLCMLLFCLTRSNLFIHAAFLTFCSLGYTALELGRGNFCVCLCSTRPYPTGLFQADLEGGQILLSWRPRLWTCFLSYSCLSGSWTPPFHGHCSQGCLWSSHPQWVPPCWWVWDRAERLSLLAPLSPGQEISHQCTPGTSWIGYILLYFFQNTRGKKASHKTHALMNTLLFTWFPQDISW